MFCGTRGNTQRHHLAVEPFRLTTWWDLWWWRPRWRSRSRAFCCLRPCPCSSSTGRSGTRSEPAGSDPDPRLRRMPERSATEAGERKGGKENAVKVKKPFYFEVHLNQRCSTSHPQISLQRGCCCCCCVVWSCQAGWPRRPKAWQHWVKTTHQHQTTLVSKDMCSRPLISIITADCCLLQRRQKTKQWVVLGDEERPPAENPGFCRSRTARGSEGKKQKWSEAVGGEHHVTRWLSFSLVISERREIFKAWRVKREETAIQRKRCVEAEPVCDDWKTLACGLFHQKSSEYVSYSPTSPYLCIVKKYRAGSGLHAPRQTNMELVYLHQITVGGTFLPLNNNQLKILFIFLQPARFTKQTQSCVAYFRTA